MTLIRVNITKTGLNGHTGNEKIHFLSGRKLAFYCNSFQIPEKIQQFNFQKINIFLSNKTIILKYKISLIREAIIFSSKI